MKIESIPEDAPEMEFEFLVGDVNWDDYGGKWISPKLNNGDFDYWLVLEFINWLDATGELYDDQEFLVELSAVSPSQISIDDMTSVIESYGLASMDLSDEVMVESMSSYGIVAHLWRESGNDPNALMKKARQAAILVSGLFWFFMDVPQNRIGSTGWDTISGDLLAGLNRV